MVKVPWETIGKFNISKQIVIKNLLYFHISK
jgi:hypothetical protein